MSIVYQLNNFFHDKIPIFVLLNFILLIVLIWINRHHIKQFLQKIDKKTWFILVLIFIVALLIRIYIPPHQHIIYIDEAWYMEAGKDMLQTGNQGYYPKSIGWPFMLAIIFGVFGINNWVAIYASLVLGALTIFTVFFMSLLITKRKDLALISALLFSLFPIHIRWSASAETNVASLFFITLTLFFCFLYYRNKTNSLLWLSLVSLAFTAQFRPENYLLIPLFILGCFIYKSFKKINFKFTLPFLIATALSFANLIQVLCFQMSGNWIEGDTGGKITGSNWSLHNLLQNSLNYGANLLNGEYQPIVISILIIIGLIYACSKRRKESLFLLIWFGFNWLIYFTSWFQTLGGKERFYMSFYPVMAIFASYGIILLPELISLRTKKPWIKKCGASLLIIIISWLFAPYVKSSANMYSNKARLLETKIPELAEKDIPSNCVIVANWPTVLKSTTNLNVIDIDLFLDNPKELKERKCVLFFQDLFCYEKKFFQYIKKCNEMKTKFSLKTFKSYRENDIVYTFYEISKK